MSSQSREEAEKPQRPPPIWRNPAVIAAVLTALIGGIFGVVEVIIPVVEQRMSAHNEPQTQLTTKIATDPRELLVQADRLLAETKTPLRLRIEIIRALKQGAGEGAPPGYHKDAIDILVRYLRRAVDERRHVKDEFGLPYLRKDASGNLFEPDPRMSKPLSIIAALEALATIRDAAPAPIEVRIENIDFSYMILDSLDLSGFNASHSSFESAFLSGCDCRGTNFNNADLRRVVVWTEKQSQFDGAKFNNTRIDGSKWANVNLTGADLSRTIGRPAVWLDIKPESAQALFK